MMPTNKKTFMAARGKRVLVDAVLCLLVVSAFGSGFAYTANANFSTWVPAPKPIYDKPVITFLVAKDYVIVSNQTTILFNVAMPSTWEQSLSENSISPTLWGTIRNVTCTLDQKQILFDDTVYGRDAKPVVVGTTTIYPPNYPISINYSCSANQTSSGLHNLTVYVAADTFCQNWETIIDGYHYPCNYYQNVSTNETFTFDIAAPITPSSSPTPTLSASLAESASSLYFGSTINFTVSATSGKEPYTYTWNVDNQTAEITTSPHFSTNNQGIGEHHIFVIVADANNNTATTLTVAFDVLPNPNSSPSPSPSVAEFPNWIILPLVAVAATMIVYFRRRKL
jgi:hypothetical protein